MAIKDRTTLKGYFPTGGQPTQQQFADVLDSTFLKNETIPVANITFGVNTLTFGTITNWDVTAGQQAKLTLTGNTTLSISNMQAGQFYLLEAKQDASGSRTITLAGCKAVNSGGGMVGLSGAANSTDLVSIYYNGTTFYVMVNKSFT